MSTTTRLPIPPTLGQIKQLMELCEAHCKDKDRLSALLRSGLLIDLLRAPHPEKVSRKEFQTLLGWHRPLVINRPQSLGPMFLIKGSTRIEKEDEKSLAIQVIDPDAITLLPLGDDSNNQQLTDAGFAQLDIGILNALWNNQHLIPLSWKQPFLGESMSIFFEGTVLVDSEGVRYNMCLFWQSGGWHLRRCPIRKEYDQHHVSAVLRVTNPAS